MTIAHRRRRSLVATVLLSAACISAPGPAAATATDTPSGDLSATPKKPAAGDHSDETLPDPSRILSRTADQVMRWPARGRLTSGYGPRWGRMHRGLDIAAPVGTPIRAAQDGRVSFVGSKGGYGLTVEIRHAGRRRTRYAHQSEVTVERGDRVRRGETIGRIGMTGSSTGPHLHFELAVAGVDQDPAGALPPRR